MSENTNLVANHIESCSDGLSSILYKLGLRAKIFVRADVCGAWAMDTSDHHKAAFHLVERGTCWLHMENSQSPRLLSSGDFVVFPHEAKHCISSDPKPPPKEIINQIPDKGEGQITNLLCGYFEFQNRNMWPLLENLPEVVIFDMKSRGAQNTVSFLIQLIISELAQNKPGIEAALSQLSYLVFVEVLRSQIKSGLKGGLLKALADNQIGQALNLIHLNFQNDWTVEQFAHQVGMSRTAFSKKFLKMTNKTPMRYLAEWRMQEAIEMLTTTDQSVASIADNIGYKSVVAFRKAFRKISGKTPGKVRLEGL